MNEPWPIYAIVFALFSVTAFALERGLRDLARRRRRKRRRLASLAVSDGSAGVDIRRRSTSTLARFALVRHLDRTLVQSGTALSGPALAALGLTIALPVHLALPNALGLPARLAIALATGAAGVWLYLRAKRARRVSRFGAQLPDVLDVVVRSLRAGHPLPVSLALVAREAPEPARSEFALAVDEINYGRSITEALERLYQRVGHPELRFLVASTAIAQQTGGNLGEVLSRLSHLIRERFRLARRVRALSAEGRFSGLALSVLPIALFGLINLVSASYYADLWASTAARPVVAVSLGLLLVGNLLIYRMVNFRV